MNDCSLLFYRNICNELLNMLRPEKTSKSNGSLKILDGPIHLGSMAENQDNTVEEIKSIWVAQRDDTLVRICFKIVTMKDTFFVII